MDTLTAQDLFVHSPQVDDALSVPRAARRITIAQVLLLGAAVAGLALVYVYVSPLIAGVAYLIGYPILAWVRPDLALMLMFAATAFPYDVGGGPVKMAVGEISLVLATPALVIRAFSRGERVVRNPMKWPIIAYFAVCLISSGLNGITGETLSSMGQMFIYMVLAVFVFSSCVSEYELFNSAFAGLLLSASVVAVMLVATRQEYVFGVHKNANGATLSFAMVVCGEFWFAAEDPKRKRRWTLLLLLLLGGLFFSLSRGAWVGAAAGLGVVAALRRKFRLLLRGAIVASLVIGIGWQFLSDQKKDYVGALDSESHNVKARIISVEYAMHYFESSPLLGVGVGLRKQYDATNVIVAILAETGIAGLVTFMSIFLAFAAAVWRNRARIPSRDPAFSLLAIGAGLMLCQFLHGLVDHYWTRILLTIWASAGMAIYAMSRANAPVRDGGSQ